MKRFALGIAALALALGMAGCGQRPEEGAEPATVTFEGQTDPKIVGEWVKEDGNSKYVFQQDGTYTFSGRVNTPNGQLNVNEKGEWRVKDGEMRFKRPDGVVLAYTLELTGDSLKMTTKGSLRNVTSLRRAK
ncbi:MAG: hypothetical protein N2109_12040 [Fimbriimonadales bacterium]|nr:hypothetical protein [Fimbriimonadales bacterium]